MERIPEPDWSDLLPEMAILPEMAREILCRLPSLADRARFRSVCRRWRLAAQKQLPPAFPWLATSWRDSELDFIGVPDGVLHHLPVRVDTSCCVRDYYTSEESLVYDVYPRDETIRHHSLVNHILLVDPFSEATMTLPKSSPYVVGKILLCSDNLVATIFIRMGKKAVAFCRPGASSWSVHHPPGKHGDVPCLDDIAVQGGKLYAFYDDYDLYAYDLRDDDGTGEPKFTCLPCCMSGSSAPLRELDFNTTRLFLVPSSNGNKLLLVICKHRRKLTVLELETDLDAAYSYRWSEVTSLDDQLLFISPLCSRALRASHYGAAMQGNRIFFITEEYDCFLAPTHQSYDERQITDSGAYDMSTKTVCSIFLLPT